MCVNNARDNCSRSTDTRHQRQSTDAAKCRARIQLAATPRRAASSITYVSLPRCIAYNLHKIGALGATAIALATVVLPEGARISIGTCFAPQKKCPGSAFRPAMGKLPIVMRDVSSGLTNSIIRIMIDPSGSKDNGHMWQLAQDTRHKRSLPSRPLTGQIQHVQADNHRIQTDYHGR